MADKKFTLKDVLQVIIAIITSIIEVLKRRDSEDQDEVL